MDIDSLKVIRAFLLHIALLHTKYTHLSFLIEIVTSNFTQTKPFQPWIYLLKD